MRSSVSIKISSAVMASVRGGGGDSEGFLDERADGVAGDGALDVALALEVEDQDRHLALLARRERLRVDDAQVALDHVAVGEAVVEDGVRVDLGVFAVDAV